MMFGLPAETFLLVFGFPLAWIIYTLVFMKKTEHWDDESEGDDS